MIKIVIDKDIPFLDGILEPYAEVVALDGRLISPAETKDADVLVVRTRTRCDSTLLDTSSVRTIITATIGTDHIDTLWCASRGIEVFNAAGCNARGVLQWVAAVLNHYVTTRNMTPDGLTLGVVGAGNVGSLVLEYARQWGFKVVCCDPPREEREHCGFLPLDELFAQSDIVTLHVPLNAETHHLVDGKLLAAATPRFIINSSRGEVVDTEALLASSAEFALDVWENEPQLDLRAAARAVIATPHIAGYSLQGKANASARVVEVLAQRHGLPLEGWYPSGVHRTVPRPVGWQELSSTIGRYFPIEAESKQLKSHPELFEPMRNNYRYREEYF